jgi:hypothetical protein
MKLPDADPASLRNRQRAHVRRRSPAAAFHIVAPDFQVLVRISDLKVVAGEARPAQIVEAIAWARAHRESLALEWAELNERG